MANIDITDLIRKYEGFSSKAYKCPAGVWTIGWGSTFYQNGSPVKEGDHISVFDANVLLAWYCQNKIKVPAGLTTNQKTALYSLIYNIGQSAFDKSKLKKAIVNKDWVTAFREWDWITANGKVLKGLIARRLEEKSLFFADIS